MKKNISLFLIVTMIASLIVTIPITVAAANMLTPIAAVEYNGHTYHLYDESMTWKEAKLYCENSGGYLVTLTSKEEQEAIVNLIQTSGYGKGLYWLGAMYQDDQWQWVTSEKFTYYNWADGEPTGNQGYLAMYTELASLSIMASAEQWKWLDNPNEGISSWSVSNTGFICEWGVPEEYYYPSKHFYAIYDDVMSWSKAKARCEEMGGHLATISSEEEQKEIEKLLSNKKILRSYWLGGYKDNEWKWLTSEPFIYTNWAKGEPNGGRDMVLQIFSPVSGYTDMEFKWDDTWNDGDKGGGIKQQGFICEWDEINGYYSSNSTSPNAPVIKSANLQYKGKNYDIINQSVVIEKGTPDIGKIKVDIEWKGTSSTNQKVYLTQGASTKNDSAFVQFNNINKTFEYVPLGSVFDANKPIYIIAVDEGDAKNKSSSLVTKINIVDFSEDDVFNRAKDEESKLLKLGEDIEFTIPEDVPVFGGMELSWKLNFIPITTEIQDNKIKVAIGLDVKEDGEFIFENLRTDVKDFVGKCKTKYNDNLSEYLEDLSKAKRKQDRSLRQLRNDLRMSEANRQKNKGLTMSMWGNKVLKGTASNDLDAGVDCLGYLIADRDKNTGEWIFSEGCICFEAKVSYTHNGQVFVYMIPCYYTIGGDFTAALSGTVRDMDFRNFHPEFQAEVMAKVGATVGVGVGIPEVAGFDMMGNGNLNVKFGINTFEEALKDYMKVFIGANAKFKLTLLGQVVAEKKVWELDENKGIIYSTYPEDADKSWIKPMSASLMSVDNPFVEYNANNVYEAESRDYLENSMKWYGDMPHLSLFAADYTNKNLTILADNVYPQAQPQIFSVDGTKILVFTADNDTRTANNKQMLVYSVYNDEGRTWSKAAAVNDDGTADFYPSVYGEYLVWQNQKSAMGDGLSLAEIGKQGEIVIAKWNGDGFDAPVSLTDNDALDTLPKVSANNNEISVVWLKNSANDILGVDGNTSIVKKVYNGSAWGEEFVLKDCLNTVADLSVGYCDNALNVAYVHDVDDDISTIDDREVYLIGTSEKQVTDNEVLDSNAIINNSKLYWYSENNIHFMNLADGTKSTVFEDARYALADGFTVSEDNDNIAILWSGSEDESSEIKGVLYQDGAWGDVITVSELGAYAKYPTCVLEEDGTILTSFTAEADGITSLYTLGLFPSYDLAISDIYFDEKNLALNSENEFEVMITNNGELPAHRYTINVYNEDGTLNNSIVFDDTIKAGESKVAVGKFITGDTVSYETLKIEIALNADEEYIYDNNTVTLTIGNGDVCLEDVSVHELLPSSIVNVDLSNKGYSAINDITVNLRADNVDGEIVQSIELISLLPGQKEEITFSYNPFEYENVKWYVTIEVEADDVSVGNNYDYFINECAVDLEDYEISILNYSYADKQLTVNAFAKNNTNDAFTADAVFAVYSSAGKLKGITTQPLSVDGYSDTGIDVWFEDYTYASGDYVKMFMWDGLANLKPLVNAELINVVMD